MKHDRMDRAHNTGAANQAYNEENAYNEREETMPEPPEPPEPSPAVDGNTADTAKLMPQSETITLGMGCFWSPEALFGHVPGVLRTRVGYAGGTTERPTYHEMGDHSETVEIEFDPNMVPLEQLLGLFWKYHKPVNINGYKGRQYWSLALYRSEEQRAAIERMKQRLEEEGGRRLDTEVAPCRSFYLAEARHQKYYLKRFPDAVAKLTELYGTEEQWVGTRLAARLNGLAKGYTSMGRIAEEISRWPEEQANKERLITAIRRIRW